MSFFKGYLKERWKRLLMLLLFACIFAFSFWVYRLPVRAVIYPCALCLLFGAVFAAYDITKAYRRHKLFRRASPQEYRINICFARAGGDS